MATSKKNEAGGEQKAELDNKRSLDITIINASNLPLRWGRPPKPFVKIEAGGIKSKTKTVTEATTQPVWNESFPFVQLPPSSVVSLRVFHDGTFWNTFLCRAAIEIDELLKSSADNSDVILKLLPSANGGATLTVHAREARRSDALDLLAEGLAQSLPSPSHPIVPAGARVDEFIENVSSHESIRAIVTVLETFVQAMDQFAKIHLIVNVAWKVVHALYQLDRDDKVVRLITQIGDLYVTVRALEGTEKIKELESVIEAILQQTIECVLFIREYQISGHITLVTARVSNRVEKMFLMGQLTPVDMETFDLPRCQPGTRSSEIQAITEWVMDPDATQRILWLPGPAGFGKSTLSTTLADTFAGLRRLGAFLFFNHDVEERSTPSKVVKTLAYQLALFDHRIAEKVSKLLDESPYMTRSHVRNQFVQLVVKPLCSIEALDDGGPLVLVLDALDECGNAESRRSLLSTLVEESQYLPSCVRILIMSWPSNDIASAFGNQPHIRCCTLEITTENSKDVKAFLHHSVTKIAKSKVHLALDPD
ncbi:hypothetical protein BOTBODRAFT_168499 [Botryobasidium botryosum FD-172 SS1]|uniref:C2 domain-containing protein n=1 Tax=Botryobasidium botryosum (strain FD-172 SS1) TaxID=930990 RepID=A0A067N2H9_BOTB1|nr:hypothetical protein BOTBODRAFT_168499 [Botryobasidium botryosum FD-172 SS1]